MLLGAWNIKHVNKIALFKCNKNIIADRIDMFSNWFKL